LPRHRVARMAESGGGDRLRERKTGSAPLISMEEHKYQGLPAIHRACWNGDLAEVKRLGLNAHRVSERDEFGGTPLHLAAMQGNMEIVRFLLRKGADPAASNNYGVTPLHDACEKGYVGVSKYLVSKGARLGATDANGLTPADRISSARKRDFLKQLEQIEERYLEKSAQKQDKSFWVPLLSIVSVMVITFYVVSQFTT